MVNIYNWFRNRLGLEKKGGNRKKRRFRKRDFLKKLVPVAMFLLSDAAFAAPRIEPRFDETFVNSLMDNQQFTLDKYSQSYYAKRHNWAELYEINYDIYDQSIYYFLKGVMSVVGFVLGY